MCAGGLYMFIFVLNSLVVTPSTLKGKCVEGIGGAW